MNFNQLLFGTTDTRGDLVKIECQYCPMSISGYESHIKQLIERQETVRTPFRVERLSALEQIGWVFPDDVEITNQVITGLCPSCSIADSEG